MKKYIIFQCINIFTPSRAWHHLTGDGFGLKKNLDTAARINRLIFVIYLSDLSGIKFMSYSKITIPGNPLLHEVSQLILDWSNENCTNEGQKEAASLTKSLSSHQCAIMIKWINSIEFIPQSQIDIPKDPLLSQLERLILDWAKLHCSIEGQRAVASLTGPLNISERKVMIRWINSIKSQN